MTLRETSREVFAKGLIVFSAGVIKIEQVILIVLRTKDCMLYFSLTCRDFVR